MSKEFNSIGVNTDPMSVQLYFDENNAIKWKIIFKNDIGSEIKYEPNNSNSNSNSNNTLEPNNISEHLINKLYPNIYIINSKNMYQFKCNNIELLNDDNNIIQKEIDYANFDYIKYNRLIGECLSKNISWKHYMKNIKKDTNIDIKLNDIDLSEINALINIINNAISLNYTKILIIFDDITINFKNLSWLDKNNNNYDIINSDILLLKFIDNNISDKKITSIGQINKINSFVIKKSLYNIFLKKLLEKTISWETCLLQIIDDNPFRCNQINLPIFS
jgi:hypothetical protein